MPDPTRDFAQYSSLTPSPHTDMPVDTEANILALEGDPHLFVGFQMWNSNTGGWNFYDGGDFREPDGAGNWKDLGT